MFLQEIALRMFMPPVYPTNQIICNFLHVLLWSSSSLSDSYVATDTTPLKQYHVGHISDTIILSIFSSFYVLTCVLPCNRSG